ncbi:MAG: ABC transporter ATP-binding protein [Verrucomicrobia bacterium]|nr:ABC transporter ATP-binding protein [Verrucomicrobiota bacterium]
MLLEAKNLEVSYRISKILNGISMSIPAGKITGLLGTNDAGKTTLLKTLSGYVKVSGSQEMKVEGGGVFLNGVRMDQKTPDQLVKHGICHVPEGREIFPDLTVEENLYVGAYLKSRNDYQTELEGIYEMFPILADRRNARAEVLSGGEQQMLAISRALMANPDFLLLDEPSLGLAPVFVRRIFEVIKEINQRNVAILLVEQNAELAMDICDFCYVMENGKIMAEGTSEELRKNNVVRQFYLGISDGEERRQYADAKSYRRKKVWR